MFDYQYGTSGDDYLSGGPGDDVFFGYGGDDFLIDTEENSTDYVYAGAGNDWIFTGPGDDYAYGYSGDDTLFGDRGSDNLYGNSGDDLLIGAYFNRDDPGKGDIDLLSGGDGSDTFVLGERSDVFYDSDTSASSLGTGDYALISDFDPNADKIQLHGSSSEYVIGGSGVSGISGLGIYHHNMRGDFELIGILEDISSHSVSLTNSSQFVYV